MLQVSCDWSTMGTAKQLESKITNFHFRGPGWYLTDTDSILVLPMPEGSDLEKVKKNIRVLFEKAHWVDKANAMFKAYVFNCRVEETLFGWVGLIRTRQDDRSI